MSKHVLLECVNLRKNFGGVVAVNDLSCVVEQGTIVGLLGPNGAGKTTLVNLISGIEECDAGEVFFKEKDITNMKSYERARLGMGRTNQITRVFGGMTVVENLCVPRCWRGQPLDLIKTKAIEILDVYGLVPLKDDLARNLSGGQQKLLELARVSMLDPDLFLLDEPFYGIHVTIKKKILSSIASLNKNGKTFIIVSHDTPELMKMCNCIIVMNAGNIIAEGIPKDIQENPKVIEAYLGGQPCQ